MINPDDLREYIIKPTLSVLAQYDRRMNTNAAVEQLMGTAAQESLLGYHLTQIEGPALGIYQIEPATHDSIWEHYLAHRPELASIVRGLASQHAFESKENRDAELITNLAYATAIARLVYWPKPEPMPSADDREGQAEYWKEHFNTELGDGTVEEYVDSYQAYVL